MCKRIFKNMLIVLFWSIQAIGQNISELQKGKIKFANEKLQLALEEKDTMQMAEAYYLFAKIEESKSNLKQATALFLKSLRIQENRKDYKKIARLYLRLSEMESKQNHYTESLRYTHKALEYYNKNPFNGEIEAYYNALGQTHSRMWVDPESGEIIKENYDSALYYYKKTESLELLQRDEINLARVRLQIAEIYSQLNDKRAISYFQQVIEVYEKDRQQTPLLFAMLGLTGVYLKNQKNVEAFEILKRINKKIENGYDVAKDFLVSYEGVYADYYQNIGDWKKALEHYKIHQGYLENLYLKDRNGAVSQLNIAYDTEGKQKKIIEQNREIALQEEVLVLQKRFLWLLSFLLILTIVVGYVFFKLFRKNQELSRRNSILLQEQNHRVKNNLQVISSLLNLQSNLLENGKAKQAVDESKLRIEAIAILHRQLYDNQEVLDKINMSAFVVDLTEIILQTYNLTDIEVIYDIRFKELNNDKSVFVGLLLNELLTNACKYAFQDNPEPKLEIRFFKQGNELVLRIKDNGSTKILFTDNTLDLKRKTPSFGLKLINMMVMQINGAITYHYENGSEFTLKFRE
jgi:two-component system, sensor histidine kinase PdtaS